MASFFQRPVILENKRARLVPLSMEYYDDLERIALDPDLWIYTTNYIRTHTDLDTYIVRALSEKADGEGYPFVIFDKQTGEIAGSTRFGNISYSNKRLEIGWTWLAKKFRSTGLNLACKQLLLQFAFDEMGFNRVELKTDVLNTASRRAIMKIGGKEEGILRAHIITDEGRIRDTVYYSILRQEWTNLRHTVFSEFY